MAPSPDDGRREQAAGSPTFQQLLGEALESPIAKAEVDLYAKLGRR